MASNTPYTPDINSDSADFVPSMGDYKTLQPFRYWCQKVLPLVYDDSLSYYELLCKVVDYLNKTMEDVETLHDDVDDLHTAYGQLQNFTNTSITDLRTDYENLVSYVNNYFSTLDVQQEINNKLDAMALNGTLTTLMAPYVPNAVAIWMSQHLTPTSPVVDDTLSVSGAAADAKVTGDKINNLSIATHNINTASLGRWKLNSSHNIVAGNTTNCGMDALIPCEAETTYMSTWFNFANVGTWYVNFYDSSRVYLDTTTITGNVDFAQFTTPASTAYVYIWMYRSGGIDIDSTSKLQIEKGISTTPYVSPITANDQVARPLARSAVNSLFGKINVVEKDGYYTATGSIADSHPNGEKYTNKFPIELYADYRLNFSYPSVHDAVYQICTYDSSGTFIERRSISIANVTSINIPITFEDSAKYVAFSYRTYGGTVTIQGTVNVNVALKRIYDLDIENISGVEDRANLSANPLRFKACYDHLFVNNSMPNITIPHESLFHVRFSRLLGFNVIEANVKKTGTDGVYIVNHLIDNAFGRYFHHVDGETDISAIEPSTKTWDWISENVRYNSSIAKFQTRPCRLEEFLSECRQQNIIPFIYMADATVLAIANKIMGDNNYIAYGASRDMCPNAIIYHWVTRTTKEEIVAYCESVGKPFIYGMANPSAFNDTELKDIIDTLHEMGYWIGTSYNDALWYKYSYMGFDVNGTQKYVNRLENGNICNLNTMYGFSEFTFTNATETDGALVFSDDGYVQPNIANTAVNVGVIDVQVDFVGTITVYGIGEQRLDLTYTSDGSYPFFMATPIFNESPKINIKANSGTVIKDISFIASKL